MKLLPLLCLLTQGFGPTSALENRPGVVTVSEGADALLPCVLDSGHNIDKFDWKKDSGEEEKQEVLFYENGEQAVYQSEQFKGRVQIFEHELKSGNASIQIKNTRLEDNGTYTCVLFKGDKQININIRLNVGVGLKKREHITGAAPKPYIQTLEDQITWRLLECQANGVPEPDMTWENSAGEVLAKHVPKNNAQVELQLNVTRSDTYKCVVTQWSIYHQINNTEKVRLSEKETDSGAAPEPYVKHIRVEKHWSLLQCKVPFAAPKPELEWRDSSGKVLSSPLSNEDKHVTSSQDASGRLHFELLVNVTKSDLYTCVVTQRSIYHQINNTLEVRLQGAASPTGWIIAVVILVIVVIFLLIIVILKSLPKGRTQRKQEQVSLNSSSSRQNHQDI